MSSFFSLISYSSRGPGLPVFSVLAVKVRLEDEEDAREFKSSVSREALSHLCKRKGLPGAVIDLICTKSETGDIKRRKSN